MPLAAAHAAGYIHLRARLRKGEKARAEAHARIRSEHGAGEGRQRSAQIGHGHMAVHEQTFHLMEHRRVGDVRIAPVHPPRRNDGHRRLAGEHHARLHGRRVRAEDDPVGDVQGVLHVARRMIGRNVQRLEIVIFRLHFGAGDDFVAEPPENGADFFRHQSDRVLRSPPGKPAGQARVKARQGSRFRRRDKRRLSLVKQLRQPLLHAVGGLAEAGPLFGAKLGQPRHDAGDAALAPEKIHAQGFQIL